MRRADPDFAFQVQGHLDQYWASWLGEFTVEHNADGTSTLTGPIADQAELHGVLAKLRDLGITLIALTPAGRPPRSRTPDTATRRNWIPPDPTAGPPTRSSNSSTDSE